jgi:hypothetical protein
MYRIGEYCGSSLDLHCSFSILFFCQTQHIKHKLNMQYGSKSWAPGTKNIFGFIFIRTQIVYDISKWSPRVVGQHRCLVLFWYRRCLCLYSLFTRFVVWWICCCLSWRNPSQALPVIGTNKEAKVRTRKSVREKLIKIVGFERATRSCAAPNVPSVWAH